MDGQSAAVVIITIGFLLVVWDIGDKKQSGTRRRTTTRRQPQQRKTLPRPRRRQL